MLHTSVLTLLDQFSPKRPPVFIQLRWGVISVVNSKAPDCMATVVSDPDREAHA